MKASNNNNFKLLVKSNRPKIPQEQGNIIIDTSTNNKRATPPLDVNNNFKLNLIKKPKEKETLKIVNEQLSKSPADFFDNDGYDQLYDLHKTIVCECKLPMKKMQNKSTKQGFWACQHPYGSAENCKKTLSVKNALLQLNTNTDETIKNGPIVDEKDLFPPHYKTIVDNQLLYHTQIHFPNYTLSEQTNDISKIIQPTIAPITLDFIAHFENKIGQVNWIKHASCHDRDYNHIDVKINFQVMKEEVQYLYKILENTNLNLHPNQFLVPLHGIAPNDEGWLYGDANLIAIRKCVEPVENKWLVVPRIKFKNWIIDSLKKSSADNDYWKIKKIFPNNEHEKHVAIPWNELETFALINNYYNKLFF